MGGKATVLVVDDNEGVRATLAELITDWGYEAHEAAGGEEALALIEGVDADLVVSDYDMPGMTGGELARRLKVRRPGIKIVGIPGNEQGFNRFGAADRMLRKPVLPELLRLTIQELLAA